MTFLAPLVLLAGAVVAVPIVLHLVHRREDRRVVFPALRYLLRTERDHARRIRLRQILLLLLRIATVLLVVLAGARLLLTGAGNAHAPTALAIVLDNSMSSSRIVGEARVLDLLRDRAVETLDAARPDDRIWVVRVGEPWDVASPGSPAEARRRVEGTIPSAAAGDLTASVERARRLVLSTDLAPEIHLLSDLQRTAFAGAAASAGAPGSGVAPGGRNASPETASLEGRVEPDPAEAETTSSVPVLAYRLPLVPGENHHLADVRIGGGLAPVAGRRTDVVVSLGTSRSGEALAGAPGVRRTPASSTPGPGSPPGDGAPSSEAAVRDDSDAGDDSELPVRVSVEGRIRAASAAPAGTELVLSVGPFAEGPVTGRVETDPDALALDDRRFFAFTVRPPVRVDRAGPAAPFLEEALGVLGEAGRLRSSEGGSADVRIAAGGAGPARTTVGPTVVVPPADVTLLPALNRALAEAGIPWRYEAVSPTGETGVVTDGVPVDLDGVRILRSYDLVRSGGPGATGDPIPRDPPAGDRVLARLGSGEPLVVEGVLAGEGDGSAAGTPAAGAVDGGSPRSSRYLLLALPLDPAWTDLPVRAEMVPFVEWAIGRWATGGNAIDGVEAGRPIHTPPGATHVRTPAGVLHPVGGARSFARTRETGVYEILDGDGVVAHVPVNPPVAESRLEAVGDAELGALLGPGAVVVDDPGRWRREIFRERRGPELWRPLLATALLLLLLESWIAASGPGASAPGRTGTSTSRRGDGASGPSRAEALQGGSGRGGPEPTASPGTRSPSAPTPSAS